MSFPAMTQLTPRNTYKTPTLLVGWHVPSSLSPRRTHASMWPFMCLLDDVSFNALIAGSQSFSAAWNTPNFGWNKRSTSLLEFLDVS